ncbi:2-keto-3-deoxygluconate permease [Novipirellula artificiosorum]|uniref:2-keto-3-deoxygluconate permease n=1 Tax=Novipirellula artificiosorum TaxID=2528016 RepID=A0A5C6D648_9BACT|nr:2-keto-3-deoxygluconate permease [Novipirellula artificiosorum]TWU31221.1 2-keto-3-deoxygluconate permease [Novipirellula artificiosorum]
MRIKASIEKVPGGMMVIPLILGALINTFFPQVLQIGGFTTAIATGATAIIGVFLFCMGAGMDIKAAPQAIKTGIVITSVKLAVGVAIGLLVAHFFDENGLWGLSSLAIISSMTNTNGGLYAALTGEFGSKSEVGAIAIISVNDGPFLTMIALGTAGIATIPFLSLLGVVLPIAFGMIVGNLDRQLRDFLMKGGPMLIPFFAFALGCGLSLEMLLNAGLPGILLGVATVGIGGFFNVVADQCTGGTGVAGAAASSTAGNAVATPAAVALVDPSLAATAALATPQVAASTITTAILAPLLTTYIAKRNKRTKTESDTPPTEKA